MYTSSCWPIWRQGASVSSDDGELSKVELAGKMQKPAIWYACEPDSLTLRGFNILSPPTLFAGRYRLQQELGRGAAATVYLAHDETLGRQIAVKILHAELADALGHERFLREIRIASQLRHPHIVPVLDFGEIDRQLWYVMPHVPGGSLRARLVRESQLTLDDALRWAAEIADALDHAQEHGFVHRDVKPENILLDGDHAWLADFGIARGIDTAIVEKLTSAGIAVGTPAYMSPEQATGASELDGRSDVYSLSCVLFECLAGVPPFVGPNAQSVIAQRFSQAPHLLGTYRNTVPARIQDIVHRGLALVPADRPSARAIRDALRAESTEEMRASAERERLRDDVPRARVSRRTLFVAACAAIPFVLLGIRHAWHPATVLDEAKVVIFPLAVSGLAADADVASGVPSLIGLALEGVPPVRWVEGSDLVAPSRGASAAATHQRQLVAARGIGAGYLMDGSVIVGQESTTVVMRLISVASDSIAARSGASSAGRGSDVPSLALRAVGNLLPSLLEPGRRSDVSVLSERKPAAIAAFLLGERDFRRSQYESAFTHYQTALALDSSLAIAALKAARSARSLFLETDARRFVSIAVAKEEFLPGANLHFARGLSRFYRHDADSAVKELERASSLAGGSAEILAALGDVYYYLGMDGVDADSASASYYRRAIVVDSGYTPAHYHLAWLALRHHAPRLAIAHAESYERGQSPDSVFMRAVRIGAQCQDRGPDRVDWRSAAASSAESLVMLGKILVAGGADLTCSRPAVAAVFSKTGPPTRDHFGAMLGMFAAGMLTHDTSALQRLFRAEMGKALRAGNLQVLDDAANNVGTAAGSGAVAELLVRAGALSAEELWILGVWLAAQERTAELGRTAALLRLRVTASPSEPDESRLRSLQARQWLSRGDTGRAESLLRMMDTAAAFQLVEWGAYDSRAADNLLLAQIALRRKRYAEAIRFASRLEHPYALMNSAFLRQALGTKQQALRLAGDAIGADHVRAVLTALDSAGAVR